MNFRSETTLFSASDDMPDKRKCGLFSITESLKIQKIQDNKALLAGETPSGDSLEASQLQSTKSRRRRMDRTMTNNNCQTSTPLVPDYVLHNNNNHVKNERLSPGTPDTSSRSRSVTPSSATHPDTPPASENPLMGVTGRNYSDFMRSLAAKYNNANPNDYFSAARNGFPPPLDPRFKPSTFPLLPTLAVPQSQTKDASDLNNATKKPDFSLLNPFAGTMFPPLIDMSTTQMLLGMVRTAKEAELQGLLKNVKRQDSSSPLDLSAAAPPTKRPRIKTPLSSSPSSLAAGIGLKRSESESPRLHEDITNWTVEDVCNFISSIDICTEYAQTFREQSIDGAGLPMLTEDHLTSTMNMKLGPALKLRSILAKKMGSCSVCLHCSHCHNNTSGGSPEPGNTTGNTSDSGGATS